MAYRNSNFDPLKENSDSWQAAFLVLVATQAFFFDISKKTQAQKNSIFWEKTQVFEKTQPIFSRKLSLPEQFI